MSEVKLPELETWDIDKILPYEFNSKIHDKKQVEGIVTSIKRFGFDQPIVVDANGMIIKGHGRRLACIELGLKRVPVLVRRDLTPEQVNAARVADNRVAIGDVDTDMLKFEMESINLDDLRGIFEDKELEFLNADLTSMDDSLFVTDLDQAVSRQVEETEGRFAESQEKRIPIAKALGFKDVAGADLIHINRFVAAAESKTGKKGADAFIEAIRSIK